MEHLPQVSQLVTFIACRQRLMRATLCARAAFSTREDLSRRAQVYDKTWLAFIVVSNNRLPLNSRAFKYV